jgi:hypothetical protein
MALKGEQLDKLSLQNIIIKKGERKEAKKQHKRKKRREAKNVNADNPQYNRYGGWIG